MTNAVFRPTFADIPFPLSDAISTSENYIEAARGLITAMGSSDVAKIERILAEDSTRDSDIVGLLSALSERDLNLLSKHPKFLLWLARRVLSQPDSDARLAERTFQAAIGRTPENPELWQAYFDFLTASGQVRKAEAVRHLSRPARLGRFTPPAPRSQEVGYSGNRVGCFDVTIVIPVFGGPQSLDACLKAVLAQRSALNWHMLLVNDGSVDRDVLAILEAHQNHPKTSIITLPANKGYIGAVNAALASVSQGDVLLLNSDCIVPSGDWLDRLKAHADDRVGTVTPFASNGEYLSFPLPFQSAPAFLGRQLDRIDRAASKANQGVGKPILTSVGYCTYITRQCLAATGNLSSEGLEAGYGEEVDFCLRASTAGFEHVAACDVYVTHVGSTSFRSAKRQLVKRNEDVLRRRYPSYFPMFQAQIAADPLRDARAGIELQLMMEGSSKGGRLVVTTSDQALMLPLAWSSLQRGDPLRILEITIRADRSVVASLTSPGLLYPQNLRYTLPKNGGRLREALQHLSLKEVLIEACLKQQLADHSLLTVLGRIGMRQETFCLSDAEALPADLKRQLANDTYAGLYL